MPDNLFKFDSDSDIPVGDGFVSALELSLPHLSISAKKYLALLSNLKTEPVAKQQRWLTKLRKEPSAGDALFELSTSSDLMTAWLAKDFAISIAAEISEDGPADFSSLLFIELFVAASEEFDSVALRGDVDDVGQFAPIIVEALRHAGTRLTGFNVAASQLYQVLRFRSVENELRQNQEGMLTDEQLSAALGLSQDGLKDIKALNFQLFALG